MNITRQGLTSNHDRDKTLEAQINLCKGWWRARNKEDMRSGFRRMANLIAMRRPKYVADLEAQIFGYYL